jgi:hypothetical protein
MAWEPDYINPSELKDFITQGAVGEQYTKDDQWLEWAVSAASRAIDRECSDRVRRTGIVRQFGRLDEAEARYYTPYWSEKMGRWVCEIDDLMAPNLVVQIDNDQDDVHETTVTDYVLRPRDAPSRNRPYTQIAFKLSIPVTAWPDSVKAVDRWGWTDYPTTVKNATQLQGSRFFARRTAPFGTRGSPTDDTEESLEFQCDPDVQHMLKTYVRSVETLWT